MKYYLKQSTENASAELQLRGLEKYSVSFCGVVANVLDYNIKVTEF